MVLCTDQQHWRALGCLDPFFETPSIDALAAKGTAFREAYCASPQCSPSRAAMMSGFYPHKAGVQTNWSGKGNDLKLPSFGRALQAAGYHTIYLGKWHLSAQAEGAGWDQQSINAGDGRITADALEFLAQAPRLDKPFALVLMYLEPHGIVKFRPEAAPASVPSDVPLGESWDAVGGNTRLRDYYMEYYAGAMAEQPREAFQAYRQVYKQLVSTVDGRIGEVLGALDKGGLVDRTAVFLTSDHGDMDTHHRLVSKGPFMYDQLVRVPMIAHLPPAFGGKPGPVDRYAWVNVDLAPTLLDLAGGSQAPCDGISAVPLLRGEELAPRPYVISQFYSKKDWICPVRMLRTPTLKYNRYIEHGEELFDLERDPWETTNLAADEAYAERKATLSDQLDNWITANADPFPTFQASPLRNKPFRRRR